MKREMSRDNYSRPTMGGALLKKLPLTVTNTKF